MARVVDALSIVLLAAAGVAFTLGVLALGDHSDLRALYFLALGGVSLKGATDLLRPRGSS